MGACDSAVGWKGFCKINGLTLPFKTGSANDSRELIESKPLITDGPVGRSIYNYTYGKSSSEAKVSTEVFGSGEYARAFVAFLNAAVGTKCGHLNGGSGGSLVISPAGLETITIPGSGGKAVVNGFNIRGNPGGNVQADFSLFSTNSNQSNSGGSASTVFESPGTTDDSNPVPYYSSSLITVGSPDDVLIQNYLTDWSLSFDTPITPVYTFCNTDNLQNGIPANDLRPGPIDIKGSFTYYRPAGSSYDNTLSTVSLTINLICCSIVLPSAVFLSDCMDNSGPNQAVFRKVSFKAYGNKGASCITISSNV